MMGLNLFKYGSTIRTFSADESIFRLGDYGDEMYVVQEGQVEIRLGEQLIELVEAGGILGEVVMINSPVRTASAIARTNCQLVAIKSQQFRFMVQETPYFAEWMLDILVKRIVKMNQMVFPNEFSHLLEER